MATERIRGHIVHYGVLDGLWVKCKSTLYLHTETGASWTVASSVPDMGCRFNLIRAVQSTTVYGIWKYMHRETKTDLVLESCLSHGCIMGCALLCRVRTRERGLGTDTMTEYGRRQTHSTESYHLGAVLWHDDNLTFRPRDSTSRRRLPEQDRRQTDRSWCILLQPTRLSPPPEE